MHQVLKNSFVKRRPFCPGGDELIAQCTAWLLSPESTPSNQIPLMWNLSQQDTVRLLTSSWKHFRRYWPFVREIHRSPVNSHHKSQWRGALMFSLIFARTNGWANNRDAGHLRQHHAHYNVSVIKFDQHFTDANRSVEYILLALLIPFYVGGISNYGLWYPMWLYQKFMWFLLH